MSLSRLASVSAYSTSVSASVSTISSRPAPNDPSAAVGGTDEDDARISLLSSSPLPEVAAVKKAKRAMAANTSSPKTATSPPPNTQASWELGGTLPGALRVEHAYVRARRQPRRPFAWRITRRRRRRRRRDHRAVADGGWRWQRQSAPRSRPAEAAARRQPRQMPRPRPRRRQRSARRPRLTTMTTMTNDDDKRRRR